jgi:hypothetical protein
MSAADYLVRWSPNIVEATADDIARFGPNAAQVRALLNYLPTVSIPASNAARFFVKGDAAKGAWNAAMDAVWRAQSNTPFRDFGKAASNAIGNDTGMFGYGALDAEVTSHLISPEIYRTITNPLNTGRILQERMGLMLPNQQGRFMQLIRGATSPEDILAIERLSGNPNVDALLEMLAGMAKGQSLARRIKAAETMYRAGRGGRGMA